MSPFNPLAVVHKGLRMLLFDTARQLQQADFADAEECAAATERVGFVVDIFKSYSHSWVNHVLRVVVVHEPSVSSYFPPTQLEGHTIEQNLCKLLSVCKNANTIPARTSAAEEMTKSFVQFVGFNLQRMDLEEQVVSPLLWLYHTEVALQRLTLKMAQAISPTDTLLFSHWLMLGLNNAELITWLKETRQSAPVAVFKSLLVTAETALTPERWTVVCEGLQEGTMVA